jgi:hypothetical protein
MGAEISRRGGGCQFSIAFEFLICKPDDQRTGRMPAPLLRLKNNLDVPAARF